MEKKKHKKKTRKHFAKKKREKGIQKAFKDGGDEG